MDADRFDALAVALARAQPRRSVVRGAARFTALAGVGSALAQFGRVAADVTIAGCVAPGGRCGRGNRCCDGQCRGGRCRCGQNERACRRRCVPIGNCCDDGECEAHERCRDGACVPCLGQGADCTDDAQCCTGICDQYDNRCHQVRVRCTTDDDCPNGRCCFAFTEGVCVYEHATQGACTPETECGVLTCADRCRNFRDGTSEFCGVEGSAACRAGRCCCPHGVPLSACPDIQHPERKHLPRCP